MTPAVTTRSNVPNQRPSLARGLLQYHSGLCDSTPAPNRTSSRGYFGAPRVTPEWSAPGLLLVGGPAKVIAADLDQDQHVDLIVARRFFNDIAVLWNLGGRSFSAPTTVRFEAADPGTIQSLAAADLDGDQDLDLAAGTTWAVCTAWNQGARRISLLAAPAVAPSAWITPVPSDDGNGTSLAFTSQRLPITRSSGLLAEVAVLRFEAALETFRREKVTRLDKVYDAIGGIASTDFDGDGNQELAVLSGESQVWLLSDKGGHFATLSRLHAARLTTPARSLGHQCS